MEGGGHVRTFPQTEYPKQVPQPCDFCLEGISEGEAAGWDLPRGITWRACKDVSSDPSVSLEEAPGSVFLKALQVTPTSSQS